MTARVNEDVLSGKIVILQSCSFPVYLCACREKCEHLDDAGRHPGPTHTQQYATALAALEVGAMAYARGLIDHQWRHYVRYDGMIRYRAEEVAQQASAQQTTCQWRWWRTVVPLRDMSCASVHM